MNIYQRSRPVCCGIGRVGCLCGWGEDQGNWFLTKCVLDLIQLLHFSPLLYLHRNHLRWVNFRGQPSCENLESFFVPLGLSVCVCVYLSTIHACVLSLFLHERALCFVASNLCSYMCCPCEGSTLRRQALRLPLPQAHKDMHTHIMILTVPFYTRLWRGAFWWQSIAQTTALCQYLDSTIVL